MYLTDTIALRARTVYPLAEELPARGWEALAAPLRGVDNGAVLLRRGVVEAVDRWPMNLPSGTEVRDLGDVALIPGLINAHCHIQLSWTAGRTLWGRGFAPWLRSLIRLLQAQTPKEDSEAAIDGACAALKDYGTRHVADYAGRELPVVDAAAARHGVGITHLCEWFGAQAPLSMRAVPGRRNAAARRRCPGWTGAARPPVTPSTPLPQTSCATPTPSAWRWIGPLPCILPNPPRRRNSC